MGAFQQDITLFVTMKGRIEQVYYNRTFEEVDLNS